MARISWPPRRPGRRFSIAIFSRTDLL